MNSVSSSRLANTAARQIGAVRGRGAGPWQEHASVSTFREHTRGSTLKKPLPGLGKLEVQLGGAGRRATRQPTSPRCVTMAELEVRDVLRKRNKRPDRSSGLHWQRHAGLRGLLLPLMAGHEPSRVNEGTHVHVRHET